MFWWHTTIYTISQIIWGIKERADDTSPIELYVWLYKKSFKLIITSVTVQYISSSASEVHIKMNIYIYTPNDARYIHHWSYYIAWINPVQWVCVTQSKVARWSFRVCTSFLYLFYNSCYLGRYPGRRSSVHMKTMIMVSTNLYCCILNKLVFQIIHIRSRHITIVITQVMRLCHAIMYLLKEKKNSMISIL